MLLAKNKLNTTKVLISKALIDSYINHYEFDSLKIMLSGYEMKKEI